MFCVGEEQEGNSRRICMQYFKFTSVPFTFPCKIKVDKTCWKFNNLVVQLQEAQGGNTVIMRLSKGQSVWLAAFNTANTSVDGREDYRFSTLSGVLLYE